MAYRIQEIEGIGPSHRAKLEQVGIRTTTNLLEHGASPADRVLLGANTGLSPAQILRWCNQADLMRVTGVGRQYAELLEASGVDTVRELAQRNADNLAARMKEINKKRKLSKSVPSTAVVRRWIEGATRLEGVLRY